MEKVRVIYKSDKTIAIYFPNKPNMTNDELNKEMEKAGLKGLDFEDIPKSDIPADRTNRNNWTKEKGEPIKI